MSALSSALAVNTTCPIPMFSSIDAVIVDSLNVAADSSRLLTATVTTLELLLSSSSVAITVKLYCSCVSKSGLSANVTAPVDASIDNPASLSSLRANVVTSGLFDMAV